MSREQSVAGALIALYAPYAIADVRESVPELWPWPFSSLLPPLVVVLGVTGLLLGGLNASLVIVALCGIVLAIVPRELNILHALPLLARVLPNYAWPLTVLPLTQAAGSALGYIETRRGLYWSLGVLVAMLLGFPVLGLISNDVAGAAVAMTLAIALRRWEVVIPIVLSWLSVGVVLGMGMLMLRTRLKVWFGLIVGIVAVLQAWMIISPLILEPPGRLAVPPGRGLTGWLRDCASSELWRLYGVFPSHYPPFTSLILGVRDFRGISALPTLRVVNYMRLIGSNYSATYQTVSAATHPLLDLAAVRCVFSDERHGFVNGEALPRARIVRRVHFVFDAPAALRSLEELVSHGLHAGDTDLSDIVVLERLSDRDDFPYFDASSSISPHKRVELLPTDDPDRVDIGVQLEKTGVLVLSDSYYPGWRAFVDGEETTIYPANVAFRAIVVPAGEHHVVFTYQPFSLRIGFWIASVAVLLLGVLMIPARLWHILRSRLFAF